MSGGDHDRVITSGAWLGAIAVFSVLAWADARLPYFLAWLLNTAVILGAAYGMAAWKRAWYAWLTFWGLAVACAVEGILKAATTLLDSPRSAVMWTVASFTVFCWYWLIRMPRREPPEPPGVAHVVHHHVLHGGDGVPAAVTASPGSLAIPGDARDAIPGSVMAAIEAGPPRRRPGGLLSAVRVRAGRRP